MFLGVKARARMAVVALALVGVVAPGTVAGARRDPALDVALAVALGESGAQSISAAVVDAQSRVWTGATGIADTATNRRATPSTPYAIASITKMFVASVAMQLVDEGVLALDEPVARWLPDLLDADRITLRQLLGHTSGFSETLPPGEPGQRSTPAEALARAGEPACEPGVCFGYVDTNYVAAGQVIAAATGRPIEKVLRTRILEPLGLERTWLQGYERTRGTVAPAASFGDVVFADPEGNTPSTDFVTRIGAAGALAATAEDIAIFASSLFGGRVVSDASLAEMTDSEASAALPCAQADRCGGPYGLGVAVELVGAWATFGHSGSTGSLVAYFPSQHVTIAVVTNGGADPYPIARALSDAIPATRRQTDLVTIDVDGTGRHQVGQSTGRRSGAAVSPDGTQIAYTRVRGRGADRNLDIAVADVDGTDERVIVEGDGDHFRARWSPDGSRLAVSTDRDGDTEISIVDADGASLRQLTDDPGSSDGAAWSPDGTLIAYHHYSEDGEQMEIRVVRPDGTDMRTVIGMQVQGRFMGSPRWSPDGTRLVFTGADGGDTDIQLVALDGSNLITLTDGHLPEGESAWASDGRIAFVRVNDIWTMNPDDPSSLERVTSSATNKFSLDWLPDGRTLMYTDRVRTR